MIDTRSKNIWKVYIHTSPNNKYYVGITSQTTNRRWGINGIGYKSHVKFYNAIKKYGWDNFEHEVVASNLTELEACAFEIKLIKLLKSCTDLGYNISSGGIGGDRKGKIKIKQYSLDGIYIKTYDGASDASRVVGIDRTRITNCCKGKSNTASGFIWEYADSKNIKSIQRKTQKTVYQYDKNMNLINSYPSIKDASTKTNIPSVSISKCVTGVNNFAYGYIFLYELK